MVPSMKATEPVGMPSPGATEDTNAVKGTSSPMIDGFVAETRPVVVAVGFTFCVSALEVLDPKSVLPA